MGTTEYILMGIVLILIAFAIFIKTRKWGVNYYTFYLAKPGSMKAGIITIIIIIIGLTLLGFVLGLLSKLS